MSNIDKINEKQTLSDLINLYKNGDKEFFKERIYTSIIEAGKQIPIIDGILGYLGEEANKYRNNQINMALNELNQKISLLEASQQANITYFLFDNIQIVQELIICATTSLNPIKYKYWANYIVNISKNNNTINFDSIELFNKFIHEFIEIDYHILRDLYSQNKTYKTIPTDATLNPYIGEINSSDFYIDTGLKALPLEILDFRNRYLINNGLLVDGILYNEALKRYDGIFLSQLGLNFYEYVVK